ncbi:hypothetical protein NHP190012_13710 [Helicobacter sp. NHP19-012]|uniref:beta-lactamase n=1 Tax=Helicobacter gastrofelis TaxID=2849642 RepID=A0ABN6IAH3_9HELI|nr:tetratricopeptide repeat protein [Helicobacter sp. NHP19-012]BCZ19729.1 hypothetical protein NHP190012_13710 [Helicobacter sp. NHP19-012]
MAVITCACRDYNKAKDLYSKAGELAYARKCYRLGMLYFKGDSVVEDKDMAFSYFLKAIKHGEARAYHSLGLIYQYGYGRSQDVARAVKCFQKGAMMGDALAQVALEKILKGHARYLIRAA